MVRRLGVLVLVLGLVAATAACGDDDDDSADGGGAATTGASADTTAAGGATGGATGGGGAATARGVTATSITVGGVGEIASYPGMAEGAQARLERANREGGVHGRTFEFLGVEDDGSDGQKDLEAVRRLVQQEEVFAVLPVASNYFLPATSTFLSDNQVPFLGWGYMPGFCDNDWGFGFNGCVIGDHFANSSVVDPVLEVASEKLGKPVEQLKVAHVAGDDAPGNASLKLFGTAMEARDVDVVYQEAAVPASATDYTPYVQAILAGQPDVVIVGTPFATAIGLTAALTAAGFQGVQSNLVSYVPGLLQAQPNLASALEGAYVNVQVPPEEDGGAAIDQIRTDLEAIGADPFISLGVSVGYWTADVFVQMLEDVGPDLTPETFSTVVNGGWTYESIDGGIGPLAFPEHHDRTVPCAAEVHIQGGAYSSAIPFTCYENHPIAG
jgi:branched-chain amino acid transport system substrate-binding protein